jgi:cysteinyl-tRNA synthetase
MALHLFNSLSRRIEEFVPIDPARVGPDGRPYVGLYCCGPTVYDYGHIGNFRTFVFADLVRRHLDFRGYSVRAVMNITDVEDKIIRRVRESGRPLREFTRIYEDAFLGDLKTLNCLTGEMPRATEHIRDIIALIQKLEQRGLAYKTADGSVWFSIDKYQGCGCRYGVLKTIDFSQMRAGERVAADEYEKEAAADFALWKARVPDDGEVAWDSPWGPGRPGWHIECSAMSMALLGPSFDLHLGGEDLAFPHHEDEIAQSEGAAVQEAGRPFVKYWLHGSHLLVEGKKMSKTLGNFFTLRDLTSKGFGGREVRQLLLSAHYRETFNFTLEGLAGARSALTRIDECIDKLTQLAGGESASADQGLVDAFTEAMDNDLNVARAWGIVFDWVRETNRQLASKTLTPGQAASALGAWKQIDTVLGLGPRPESEVPAALLALAQERVAAKKARDFARADQIREQVKAAGWMIEDTAAGPKLKPLSP